MGGEGREVGEWMGSRGRLERRVEGREGREVQEAGSKGV